MVAEMQHDTETADRFAQLLALAAARLRHSEFLPENVLAEEISQAMKDAGYNEEIMYLRAEASHAR